MKILVFSDSHGYTNNMVKVIKKNADADLIIHLGDFYRDALKVQDMFPNNRVELVPGNNDWTLEYPKERSIDIKGKTLFITHGHTYNVKNDYKRIINRGHDIKADAVFFGHTHKAEEIFSDGMLVLNPGSISVPSNGDNPSYSIVEIKDSKIISRVCYIK
ncbi:MAG: metallophosphoesterase [Clostridia bacterium]|nr:metallophosphoesterase [Clostridia bacterium]